MYGGTKAPSLLPKYVTNYIVHKEVLRQLFLDRFRSFLFDLKNAVFPPMPFYVGNYKISRVKSAPYFVKDLENFHFGEKIFHSNESQGKVATHRALLMVKFKYSDHLDKDEEVYCNAYNMTSVNKNFKRKITVLGGKGSSSTTTEQNRKEEEATQKEKAEET